jgi:3-keto-L-gulonate-6-phosphate decarboxylase
MKPIVQISLDLTNIDEALETAAMALRAGVDWLEAGTPLILAEGLHGVKKLREAFPKVPIVADLKTMDGGYLEAEMMAKAGATHVVVMARAHEETIRCVVKAGHDYGIGVMGDNLGCPDMVEGARWLEELGCGYVIHHIGYDERRGIARSCEGSESTRSGRWRTNTRTGHPLSRIRSTIGCARGTFDGGRRRIQDRQRKPRGFAQADLPENPRLWGGGCGEVVWV